MRERDTDGWPLSPEEMTPVADPSVVDAPGPDCRCDGNPSGGACSYPDCQLPPPTTAELLGEPSVVDALNTLRAMAEAFGEPLRADGLAALAVVETALADLRSSCDKAIRERRSLEIKEDDWHRAYERAEARAVAAEAERDTLRQALEGPIREGLVEAAKIIHSNSYHHERIDHEAAFRAIASVIVVARDVLAA